MRSITGQRQRRLSDNTQEDWIYLSMSRFTMGRGEVLQAAITITEIGRGVSIMQQNNVKEDKSTVSLCPMALL